MSNLSIRHHVSFWLILLVAAVVLFGTIGVQTISAEPVSVGYRGPSYGTTETPTADKPQSKLWWTDGIWWGALYSPSAASFNIHRLDLSTQTWVDTGTMIDTRPRAQMDALWDGQRLYMVSGTESGRADLLRYSYNSATKQYSMDSGFPLRIRDGGAETITIAKDSTGKLWVTYPQNRQIWANRSLGSDTQWGSPFVLPVKGVNVTSDDLSAVIAFQGNKIGIMWSNQTDKAFYFAIHNDGAPDTTWEASKTALPGPNQNATDPWADDHINLKQLESDGSGRVFAAIKTSLNHLPKPNKNMPLNMLLVRDLNGNWSNHVFGTVEDFHTRPMILIDDQNSRLHMFATAPEGGGSIYVKSTPLNNISFPSGLGTPFIQSASDPKINNATSTKQNINNTTGMLVLASDRTTGYYLHNYVGPGSSTPTPTPTPTATPQPTATATPTPTPTLTPTPTPTPTPQPTATPIPTATPTPTPTATPLPTATPVPGTLAVAVQTDPENATYRNGDWVDLIATVRDGSGTRVSNANVEGLITSASGRTYTYTGTTDAQGEFSFRLKTKRPDGNGTYKVELTASKDGYNSADGSFTFLVN